MGGGRAGWYSWDWLDNSGQPSADHIVPEWQSLEVGRQLKGPANWWTVAVVEPNRTLVLQSSCGLPPRPLFRSAARLPASGAPGRDLGLPPAAGSRRPDRLVIRTRSRGRPRLVTRPFGLLVGEPVHFIMQTRQFHNLRTRVGAEV
jgi:proline iminopeptidase